MSNITQVNLLIQQISKNQNFIAEVRRLVQDCRKDSPESSDLPTFAFQKAAKYPWTVCQNNLPVQGQKMIEQMTDLIVNMIDNNLHEILNRQFINVTNQILVIREQLSNFKGQFEQKYRKMQQEFVQQTQSMKKKLIVQQNTNSERKQFVRTRATGVISSQASTSSIMQKGDLKGEIITIKKQVQELKKSIGAESIMAALGQRIVYVEQKMQSQIQDLKIKLQSTKQRTEKGLNQVSAKITQVTNKEAMSNQIKRAVKGHFKVYLQQINTCKAHLTKLDQNLEKAEKGLLDYIGSQLKTVWVMISNLKRRQDQMSEQMNMGNQSFIME